MQITLVVQVIQFRLAFFNILKMHIEDLREAGPQNVNGYLLQNTIKHIYSVNSLHLLFTFLIDLDHDKY